MFYYKILNCNGVKHFKAALNLSVKFHVNKCWVWCAYLIMILLNIVLN